MACYRTVIVPALRGLPVIAGSFEMALQIEVTASENTPDEHIRAWCPYSHPCTHSVEASDAGEIAGWAAGQEGPTRIHCCMRIPAADTAESTVEEAAELAMTVALDFR